MKRHVVMAAFLAVILGLSWTTEAYSETVYVKYRGSVALDSLTCTNTESSLVHRICYAPFEQYVIVLLGPTYYHYCRVPGVVVDQWLAASSKGGFYNSAVKGRFDCRLGGVPSG